MVSPDQMTSQIEEIVNSSMGIKESLRLPTRLELTHPSFPRLGRLV